MSTVNDVKSDTVSMKLTSSAPTKLQKLWEIFVQASPGTYEKSTWLDLFLAEFLFQVKDGNLVRDILSFWPAGEAGIATLIGCELLGAVHRTCSTPGQTDDLGAIRRLLLRSSGWRCLAALHALNVDGICCARELASLLISLYPVCVGVNLSGDSCVTSSQQDLNPYIQLREVNVDVVLQVGSALRPHHHQAPQRKHSACTSIQDTTRASSILSGGKTRRTKSLKSSPPGNSSLSLSSDSEQEEKSVEALNRSLTLKLHLNSIELDYFSNIIRSDEESHLDSSLYDPHNKKRRIKKFTSDDFLTDELNSVLKAQINRYEFSMLVVQILQKLSLSELYHTNEITQPISVLSLNFVLENLCSLQFGSASIDTFNTTQIAQLKSTMAQLVLVSLEKIFKTPTDVSMTIINNGILPLMLRLLEDSTTKLAFLSKITESQKAEATIKDEFYLNPDEANRMQEFVFGVAYGIITILYYQLLQRSTVDKIRDFVELFRQFSDSQGGNLIEKTLSVIILMPHCQLNITLNRVKKIIDFLGQFIVALKKARADIIHSSNCSKTKHRQCRGNFLIGRHHHQDLLGRTYTARLVPSGVAGQSCCVSSLFMILIGLLHNQEIRSVPELQARIVKIMVLSGTCCCFPPRRLLNSVVKMLRNTVGKIRPLGFALLERALYDELGGIPIQDTKSQCEICDKHILADNSSIKYFIAGEYTAQESLSEAPLWTFNESDAMNSHFSDTSTESANEKHAWDFLEQYKSLINSEDIKLSYITMSHLLRIAPRCTDRVQYELLFKVFYPTFLNARTQYDQDENEHAKFKILSCLSLFASLLGSVPFAEQFVNLGGLNQIVDLVNNADFSKACCSVLEITVIIEIWKLECELRSQNIFLHSDGDCEMALEIKNIEEMKHLPSLEMISNALECTTNEVLAIFENDKVCTSIHSSTDNVSSSQLDVEKYVQLLHNAATFWRCYASLCLYSPQMRHYITVNPASNSGMKLLLSVLKKIVATEYITGGYFNRERRLLVKLFEAVLAVNLTVPSDDSSVEIICATLRHSILENGETVASTWIPELCDALLRCATLRASPDQVMPPHCKPKLPAAPSRWDDTSSLNGDAARRLDFSDSSLADAYVTADEGYDADVEVPPDYTTTESHTSRFDIAVSIVDSCSSCDSVSILPACEASPPPGPLYAEYCRGSLVTHPELCLLAIDLLISLNKGNTFLPGGNKKFEDVLLCLQRLLVLCRDNSHNCISLAHAGAISRLLMGFQKCLERKDRELIEIQHAVLELVMLLSKHSINRTELGLYLELFKADSPPLELLLEPLVTLAILSRPQPNHIVCFPAISNSIKTPALNKDEQRTTENSALQMLSLIRSQHKSNGVSSNQSAWTACAICLPINTDFGWSMWSQGFSACMWLRVAGVLSSQQHRTNSDRLRDTVDMRGTSNSNNIRTMMHLVSIGHESLLIELWIDIVNENLIFRLTRPDVKSNKLISEVTIENCLPSGLWHHIALNVKDNIQKRKINVEITVLINGWNEVKLSLPVNGLLVRKCRPTCVLIGQIQESPDDTYSSTSGSWFLGNLMLFRCPVFTKERAIYLVGLGPNFTSLTECELDKHIPNFTSIFGPRTISNVIDWDSILDAGNGNLKELQDNLLLSYMAQNPNLVNFYPQVVSNSGGVVNQLFPSQPSFRVVTTEHRACQQLPLALNVSMMATLQPQHYQGLAAAAFVLGGIPVFMFLVARVVELEGNEQEQGMALRLLLRLIQIDGELHSQFQQQDGYRLLLCILSSNRCKPSQHILKAIIDTCCDKSVLHFHPASSTFSILVQTDAIVVAPALLRAAIGAWKAWNPEVLSALFAVLHALLRDDHPFREFNATQMNRVHLVEALLLFCKERFLYSETDAMSILSPSICCSLVELIRSLMGAPPEFCHIVAITDFLLLLHQASATYVTHVRSSFYFLLSDAVPVGQNVTNPLSLPMPIIENVSDSSFTQPIDAQKLNKALANLKTQQGRLDHRSRRRRRGFRNSNNDDNNKDIADSGIAGSYRDRSSSDPDSGINMNDVPKQIIVRAEVYENRNDSINNAIVNELKAKKDDPLSETSTEIYKEKYDNAILVCSDETVPQTIVENISTDKKADEKIKKSEKNKSMLAEQIKCDRESQDDIIDNSVQSHLDQNKNSQWLVVEGLLLLLRDTLLVLPDTMASQVLSLVVKPDILLVMANHESASVRTALIKVLAAYIQRSSEEELNKLIKNKYFHHLANQLSLYPASRELAGACGSIVTRCITSLDDQIELVPWTELVLSQLSALPPLFAILPKTLHDTILAHHTLSFIMQIFTKVHNAFRVLLDNGLIEVLLLTLKEACCKQPHSSTLLHDLIVLLVSISSQCLSLPGAHNMQVVLDIHYQLSYLILKEHLNENQTKKSSGESCLRAAQCALFDGQLDTLQERLKACHQPGFKLKTTTSYLASVLSSSYERSSSDAAGSSLKSSNPGRAHRITASVPVTYNVNLSGSLGHLFGSSQSKEVPRSELRDRLKTLLIRCVELITNVEYEGEFYPAASVAETKLVRRIFLMLIQGLSSNSQNSNLRPSTLESMVWRISIWGARSSLLRPAANLLLWLMSPSQCTKLRMFAVHSLREEPHCKDMLVSLLQTHPQVEQKFTSFLWDLMYRTKIVGDYEIEGTGSTVRGLSSAELRVCEEFKETLQCWGVISPHCVGHEHDRWDLDVIKLLTDMKLEHQRWSVQYQRSIYRSIFKYESLARSLTESAMAITRNVVEAQNSERKAFMEYMKQAYSEQLQSRSRWRHLVQQLTHEKAVWFFPKSYPRSWQLDATEGPLRIRKRLQRCNLNVNKRFVLEEHQSKLHSINYSPPLSYLLDAEHQTSAASLLIERLHTSEKVRHMCTAQVITPALDLPGELLIGESCLHFVPDDTAVLPVQKAEVISSGLDLSSISWHFDNIREIHNRRFQLQERALEIFLTNGRTHLVAFSSSKDRDMFVVELSHCHLPNRVQGDYLSDAVQLWREGLITNWEYVMQLNKMAGRSYNDLMQYPVFPFVLADYTSEILDLSEPVVYRNFKRPMAVQDKKNEQHYINNYNYLKQAMLDGMNLMALNQEPFHYGSHYSNSGTVLHFLVRLPPFTRMFLSYQDNNFDIPDRTFHALSTTWRLTSCDSTTDVKELIPEFFYLPEFLQNSEGFNFGVRQNGEKVHDVLLPSWSKNDARLFTLVHRQAFEADYVRENLPHWIDLVFGYKQTGKAAVEAINVFHPATYYGFDVEQISDPLERTAWETMVKTYGQTPCQLFRSPHPMVVQPLTNVTQLSAPQVLEGVKGLRWGTYVGSPGQSPPVVVWRHQHRSPVATLVPLITNDVFGLPSQTSILLSYSKERGLSLVNTTSVLGAAMVTWGHSDNIVRVKFKKEHPPWPLVQSPGLDPMCVCASVPDWPQLWIGHNSGMLHVYSYLLLPVRGHLELRSEPITLIGHKGPVTALTLCPAFSIAVSGSQDGCAIIWDLNNLSYVRSINSKQIREDEAKLPVTLTAISETLGDIVVVYDHVAECGSLLRAFTVNCAPVGEVCTTERITAVCYSTAPEGISVNVIATGLDTGTVRLWSSWDLSFLQDISCIYMTHSVISIAYSQDSQHLFVSASDGTVVIWESANGPGRTPKFLNLTSL